MSSSSSSPSSRSRSSSGSFDGSPKVLQDLEDEAQQGVGVTGGSEETRGESYSPVENDDSSLVENKDNSLVENNNNSVVEDNSSLVEDNNSLVEDNSSLVEDNSSLVEDNSSLVEDDSSLVEDNSSLDEDKSSLVEDNNSLVEGNGSLVEESTKANGSSEASDGGGGGAVNGRVVWGLVVKAACLIGGLFLLRKLTKRTTRRDHTRAVAQALIGEKYTTEQAARDPMTYFNLRLLTCPAAVLADGGQVLYYEQAFWRTPERPYRQRFYSVKPCPKEMNCDVEVGSYAVRDVEEYKNFCDRPKDQRPQPDEVIKDVAEHLNTVYLSTCDRGRRCLYEGSTPPGGFPNSWNGASRCTSELSIFKNGEVHSWDRAYDDDGNQVWGVRQGPYEFKPTSRSTGPHT